MNITAKENRVIQNFIGTLDPDATIEEATANAELDVRAYNLSRAGARHLGQLVRARFARQKGATP